MHMKFDFCKVAILVVVFIVAGCGNLYAPSGFSFVTQKNVPTNAVISSNVITVEGNQFPAPITISNGEYSINGGGFSAGQIGDQLTPGQTLQIQQTSASTPSTSNVTTVTVGGFTTTFTTITGVNGGTVTATDATGTVTISSVTGNLSQGKTAVDVSVNATTTNTSINTRTVAFTLQAISNIGTVVAQYIVSASAPSQILPGSTVSAIFPVGATPATLPITVSNNTTGFLPTTTQYWAETISYWQIVPGSLTLVQ
jgi:hypothetical protein